ncbi:MAG: hypothetical protein D6758_11240 [Gammaproteobacteria bacterium]|nr:MAG: hypothetical protein D6758_11240 [Gammaproteobacteria bacterium]
MHILHVALASKQKSLKRRTCVDMRSEEEQIQLIKNWWKENGTSLMIGVGLALAIVFGWKAWQQYQTEQKYQASLLYQEALNLVATTSQPGATEAQRATAAFKIESLEKQFGDTAYGQLGQLLKARLMMDEGKAEEAEAVLEKLSATVQDPAIKTLVGQRLALSRAAKGEYDAALALLTVGEESPFFGASQELRGDILKMKGDRPAAKKAYEAAREAYTKAGMGAQLVELKLEDLADV